MNYPNPFTTRTTIEFYLPESLNVDISLFSAEGKFIVEICNGIYPEGENTIEFTKENLAKGIYNYVMETKKGIVTRRLYVD